MDVIPFAMVDQPHPCKLSGVSTHYIWMIRVHNTQPKSRSRKCASFSSIHAGPSLECCVVSMDVIPLLGWLYNGIPTSPIEKWEEGMKVCQFSSIYQQHILEVFHELPLNPQPPKPTSAVTAPRPKCLRPTSSTAAAAAGDKRFVWVPSERAA